MQTGAGVGDKRLESLEIKAAFQEGTIDQLSKTVYEQEQRISRLERAMKELTSKLKDLVGEGLPPMPADERPPHY